MDAREMTTGEAEAWRAGWEACRKAAKSATRRAMNDAMNDPRLIMSDVAMEFNRLCVTLDLLEPPR